MTIFISVFETNIRVLGGLLSAHMLARHVAPPPTTETVENGDTWQYDGALLRRAHRLGERLLPAFATRTGWFLFFVSKFNLYIILLKNKLFFF